VRHSVTLTYPPRAIAGVDLEGIAALCLYYGDRITQRLALQISDGQCPHVQHMRP